MLGDNSTATESSTAAMTVDSYSSDEEDLADVSEEDPYKSSAAVEEPSMTADERMVAEHQEKLNYEEKHGCELYDPKFSIEQIEELEQLKVQQGFQRRYKPVVVTPNFVDQGLHYDGFLGFANLKPEKGWNSLSEGQSYVEKSYDKMTKCYVHDKIYLKGKYDLFLQYWAREDQPLANDDNYERLRRVRTLHLAQDRCGYRLTRYLRYLAPPKHLSGDISAYVPVGVLHEDYHYELGFTIQDIRDIVECSMREYTKMKVAGSANAADYLRFESFEVPGPESIVFLRPKFENDIFPAHLLPEFNRVNKHHQPRYECVPNMTYWKQKVEEIRTKQNWRVQKWIDSSNKEQQLQKLLEVPGPEKPKRRRVEEKQVRFNDAKNETKEIV